MLPISSGVCTWPVTSPRNSWWLRVEQPRRIDDVGAVDGVHDVGDRDLGCAACAPGSTVTWNSGSLPALDEHAGDAAQAVQARLDVVGRQFPQLGLRHRLRRQAVADDRKAGEVEPVGLDLRRRRQRCSGSRDTAASTSCSVSSMSTFQLKNRLISAEPRLVTERTSSRPGTARTASSIGRVMVTSICSIGITPLSTPMMMRGKLVVGKTATGIVSAS